MKAKVLSVYDEGALEDTSLIGAKGLSMLVEVDGQRTLFDTGMRGRYLLHNMGHLNIEPDSIDRVVLSHIHKGNVGGLSKLIEARTKPLDVYANGQFAELKKAFGKPFISEEDSAKMVLHTIEGETDLSEHLFIEGTFGECEESFLVIKTRKGPAILSSCYHNGTSEVLSAVKARTGSNPAYLFGGIHLLKTKQKFVDPTAEIFKEFGSPQMYMNHCAGPLGITFLRVHFGLDGVKDFYVGTEVQLDV